jgi:hypothetical protein
LNNLSEVRSSIVELFSTDGSVESESSSSDFLEVLEDVNSDLQSGDLGVSLGLLFEVGEESFISLFDLWASNLNLVIVVVELGDISNQSNWVGLISVQVSIELLEISNNGDMGAFVEVIIASNGELIVETSEESREVLRGGGIGLEAGRSEDSEESDNEKLQYATVANLFSCFTF